MPTSNTNDKQKQNVRNSADCTVQKLTISEELESRDSDVLGGARHSNIIFETSDSKGTSNEDISDSS